MHHSYHFKSDLKQTTNILNPLRIMSETRQLERLLFNHISASKKGRYKEQTNDYLIELEFPTAIMPNTL